MVMMFGRFILATLLSDVVVFEYYHMLPERWKKPLKDNSFFSQSRNEIFFNPFFGMLYSLFKYENKDFLLLHTEFPGTLMPT